MSLGNVFSRVASPRHTDLIRDREQWGLEAMQTPFMTLALYGQTVQRFGVNNIPDDLRASVIEECGKEVVEVMEQRVHQEFEPLD